MYQNTYWKELCVGLMGMMMLWKRALHGGALERVRVALVSPQQAGNVGFVCRVATNFGSKAIVDCC
ncbi:hypothetical protein M758_UG342100 [Ceratodon purpureus]|nr:hypothetical protein M758_UG342100 [Ceratodon purpureus]